MDKRKAHRGKVALVMTLFVLLAFGSFWLLQIMQRGEDPIGIDPGNEPDYIIEKFSFVRMTPEGHPRYLFYGGRLTHRPIDDVSTVELPIMQTMTPGEPPLTIKAETARIRHKANEVDLLGKVDVRRPASATSQNLHLRTESLTVFPDEERMASTAPVNMVIGTTTVTGKGLQANNATQQMRASGRARIVIPPKAAR